MTAWRRTSPQQADLGTVFACLSEWAGQFHDDSSPAQVTDILVVFMFVAGLGFAAAEPAAAAALLSRVEEEMPSAGRLARSLAKALRVATVTGLREGHDASPAAADA